MQATCKNIAQKTIKENIKKQVWQKCRALRPEIRKA